MISYLPRITDYNVDPIMIIIVIIKIIESSAWPKITVMIMHMHNMIMIEYNCFIQTIESINVYMINGSHAISSKRYGSH